MEASTSKCKDGQIMVLEHRHPLELVDLQLKCQHNEETDDDDDDLNTVPEFRGQCGRCSHVISEYHMYYYKCVYTCDYSLHKFCAELPPKVEHIQDVHPLDIGQEKHYSWRCDVCQNYHKPGEINYTCPYCFVMFDVNCVLGVEETKFYHPSHPHQLVSTFSKPILCVCDACGIEHKGIFYRCTICCFAIHSDCAFLPKKLQIQKTTYDKFYHTHPLILSYSFPRADQRARYYPKCRVCDLPFWSNHRLWVYKCDKCWYYAHLNCATSRAEPFMSILSSSSLGNLIKKYQDSEHPNVVHLPFTDQSHNIQKQLFFKEFGSSSSGIDKVKHAIHQHPLILVDTSTSSDINPLSCHDPLKKIELLCNACVRPIMNVPYYMCSNEDQHCNFAIHEWCTRLPAKLVNHPIHQKHTLILLPHIPDNIFRVFKCDICHLPCNGFVYSCAKCDYRIDVTCGLIPKEITHDAHANHLLKLSNQEKAVRCKACKRFLYGYAYYSCQICTYNLHIECSLLSPRTVRHRYNKHPYHIRYFPVENHAASYFCDICEDALNPNYFFYHCTDCDQSMHISCAPMMLHNETHPRNPERPNKYINIKFRGTHNIKAHPHPLSFVQGLASDGKCIRCNRTLQYELIFKCSQCKFAIHYDCCKELSSS